MRRIKTGVVGFGRLGTIHAEDIAFSIPNSELYAICRKDPDKKTDHIFDGVKIYTDYDEFLNDPEMEAVCIVSSSDMHCEQAVKALEHGKHVFVEKPLGITIEECSRVKTTLSRCRNLIFMVGFQRRFDPSYLDAKEKIKEGIIGRPYLMKCSSCDKEEFAGSWLRYSPTSGGPYFDCCVHDIDLARWIFGCGLESVYAVGDCYLYPEAKQYHDADSAYALMKFKNGETCYLHTGRITPHGYHTETEIWGTKGILRIANIPRANRVELLEGRGCLVECEPTFVERFREAFLLEKKVFFDCIEQKRMPELTIDDAIEATKIALLATRSFLSGQVVKAENK
ncbi:MAG: Gfo/Idh/MocA family oxidoreductase [Christensenella hongkongensis]|uniref:Gfo/Idh/MocA family oxidoreductase n=1 Tax=Christensenella hongkongensis TaxID=270498 RepID=UPI002671C4D5|nr:Gfo/Idh/MocA family oxidoreductase [Christensenella hongkongensis]MDY3003129.1 Gfo/Idh/MocA family oxidoreductase [Christensenella hongkongensis]